MNHSIVACCLTAITAVACGPGRIGGGELGAEEEVDEPDGARANDSGSLLEGKGTPSQAAPDARPNEPVLTPPADAGPDIRPTGLVPIFLAYGHGALTLASCDRGITWKGEHEFEPHGNDHSAYSANAAPLFARGMVITGAGWGEGARIMSSKNGFDWQELPATAYVSAKGEWVASGPGFNNMDYDGERMFWFQAGSRTFHSSDSVKWRLIPAVETSVGGWIVAQPGTVSALGSRGDGRALYSKDQGVTWKAAPGFTSGCASDIRGIPPMRNGSAMMIANQSVVCRSEDRGSSWREVRLPSSDPVTAGAYDGAAFVLISNTALYRSTDAATWSAMPRKGPPLRALAIADDGTWVGIDGIESHVLHRSRDAGRTWLAAKPAIRSANELRRLSFGWVEPSVACPLP